MAIILFDGDEWKAMDWMVNPNRRFFNMSPYEFILAGCGDTVLGHQKDILGEPLGELMKGD